MAEVCWDRARSAAASLEENEQRARAELFVEQRQREEGGRGGQAGQETDAGDRPSRELASPHPLYPAFTDKVRSIEEYNMIDHFLFSNITINIHSECATRSPLAAI